MDTSNLWVVYIMLWDTPQLVLITRDRAEARRAVLEIVGQDAYLRENMMGIAACYDGRHPNYGDSFDVVATQSVIGVEQAKLDIALMREIKDRH